MSQEARLPLEPGRDALMRLDSAGVLKRFWHLERVLLEACASWVSAVHRVETKALLARAAWEDAMTAAALRTRVFELRYPDRNLDLGSDAALVTLFESARNAPDSAAFLTAVGAVLAPALRASYQQYLDASDIIADGPSSRFLEVAVAEKRAQEAAFQRAAESEPSSPALEKWVEGLSELLEGVGGSGLAAPRSDLVVPKVIPPAVPFELPEQPARDDRYFVSAFYWPDAVDPSYPYGHGLRLQLRSAVSHLNEVWAVEAAAAILHDYAPILGWEFELDAARWLYDESRHMLMGAQRLEWWGFERKDIPLGSYIYEACSGQDPIYRLAMLAFFETKNISKKRERVKEFAGMGDRTSQRDMDFDWADEAIHAGYGRRWLRAALEASGQDPETWPELVARCEALVSERVARATEEEKRAIRACAEYLIAKAEARTRT